MKAIMLALALMLTGCASPDLMMDKGGIALQDETLRCDFAVGKKCLQWSRIKSLRSVDQRAGGI